LPRHMNVRLLAEQGKIPEAACALDDITSESVFDAMSLFACEKWNDAIAAARKFLDNNQDLPAAFANFINVCILSSEQHLFKKALGFEKVLPVGFETLKPEVIAAFDHFANKGTSVEISSLKLRYSLLTAKSNQEIAAIEFDQTKPENCLSVALAYWRINSFDDCEKTCRSFPRYGSLNALQIAALSRMDLETAYRTAVLACENSPESLDCQVAFGLVCSIAEKTQDAINAYERAARLRPDLSELQVKLARLKNEVNDFRGAIDHLEKAVLMDASNSTIMDELGHLYNKAGEFEKAVMLLKQFPEFDVNAQICLAKAYSQLGENHQLNKLLRK